MLAMNGYNAYMYFHFHTFQISNQEISDRKIELQEKFVHPIVTLLMYVLKIL